MKASVPGGGRLAGKVAVVTGGSTGIGFVCARRFAAEGASVVIFARSADRLEEAAASIGSSVRAVQGDVSSLADLERLMSTVRESFGRIDVLFANAGGSQMRSIEEVDEAYFDRIIGQNLKGTVFTVQKALPLFDRGGSIVLCSSIAASMAISSNSIYSAAKAGVRSLARSLSAELLPRGIRVNSISPGAISTGIYNRVGLAEEEVEAWRERRRQTVPMRRLGQPEEIEGAVLFLACNDSSFIAGIDLPVDGGCLEVG
jgi:NAD(P)-dependent dehydrogenase (short-subunit alcohol dehydrogenase family)